MRSAMPIVDPLDITPALGKARDTLVQSTQPTDNTLLLMRVSRRMARELTGRELAEALLIECLDLSTARYGCVLQLDSRPAPAGNSSSPVAMPTPVLNLLAIVSTQVPGQFLRLQDTLRARRPDSLMSDVVTHQRAVFSNELAQGVPSSLPGRCPQMRNFALLPIRQHNRVSALLLLTNASDSFNAVLVNRLQGLIDIVGSLDGNGHAFPPNAADAEFDSVIDRSQRQFRALAHLAPVGILELDVHWVCTHCNPCWCELSQLDLERSRGTGWVDVLHSSDVFQLLVAMREALDAGTHFRRELRLQPTRGASRWVELSAVAMLDDEQYRSGTLITVIDITLRRRAEQRLQQVAHYDPLTGLMNRGFFIQQLDELLAQKPGELALLHIDLDGFRSVNDTYGQSHGDDLLRQIARQLDASIREQDLVARLGSDEFCIVLAPMRDTAAVSVVADKIVQQIRKPYRISEVEVCLSASIGIAVGTCGTTEGRSLLREAASALFRAKNNGRSRYLFYTPALEQLQRQHSTLVTNLRQAVDNKEFELYYQPQLRIVDHELLGFEGLLRWPQPDGSFIEPGVFIDLLEQTGLIDEIGHWVIDKACAQHSEWRNTGVIGPDTTISVNVSAMQLGMPHFVGQVRSILQHYAMKPAQLILEITETALVQAGESRVIEQIRQLGVLVSLDDFGTGYSSLAYLGALPLDHLKIDRSFISQIGNSPRALVIVKSIIALARALDIRVIAEGVETVDVLPPLAREGCEAYQGFLASRPVAASQVPQVLRRLEATAGTGVCDKMRH